MVTPFILRKMDEVKDADVDTLFQAVIRLSSFQLARIHLAQIEKDAVCPVREIEHLHLQIKLSSVCQIHRHIKYPQLIIPVFLSQGSWKKRRLLDLLGILPQKRRNKTLSHLTVLHQFFKTEVHSGKHDKVVVCFCHKILLSFVGCVLHSPEYLLGIPSVE